MKFKNKRLDKGEKLRFRHVGNGFIMAATSEGEVIGRKLTKKYVDQFDRSYVQVNGKLEPVTPRHGYLGVD